MYLFKAKQKSIFKFRVSSWKNLIGIHPKELIDIFLQLEEMHTQYAFSYRDRDQTTKKDRFSNGARLGTFYNGHPPGILGTRYLTGTI